MLTSRWPSLMLTFIALLANVAAAQSVAERMAHITARPRLMLDDDTLSAVRQKLDQDASLARVWEMIRSRADSLMEEPPVERVLEGRRLLGPSRTCLQRVTHLAFAYRMTGEDQYLKRAEQEMLAAAAFVDWHPEHFLDVAEMTAALAIGYDWLHAALSPEASAAIRDAIIEKGLKASYPDPNWVKTTNNWNQVCHGGLVLGALAVQEDAPDLALRVIERAIEHVPIAMREYEPDGVYPEGPTYWVYGTTYNVLLIAALESALGSDFGLAEAPGFIQSPEFFLRSTGPTGLFFNFSDCGERAGLTPAMFWFAQRLGQPALLRQEWQLLDSGETSSDRLLPFLLIWAPERDKAHAPKELHWKGEGRTPIALLRSGWDEDATFLGIKGGSPGTNHAHMDAGSFVLDMNGVRWASDLGMQGYHSLESKGIDLWNRSQKGERWSVFRLNNFSHSTLVVDGQLQRVKGDAPLMDYTASKRQARVTVDLASIYKGQLEAALRTARLRGKTVTIEDQIKAPDRAVSVRWGMVTRTSVNLDAKNPGRAVLNEGDKSLELEVLSPKGVELKVLDLSTPPNDYDDTNPDAQMIVVEVSLAPGEEQTIAVSMSSGR